MTTHEARVIDRRADRALDAPDVGHDAARVGRQGLLDQVGDR